MRRLPVTFLSATLTLGVATSVVFAASVTRKVEAGRADSGAEIVVTLLPSGIDGFYAVAERFGGLEYSGEHTADDESEGVFIVLTPREFSYVLRVPAAATRGQRFEITGEYWTDHAAKEELPVTVIVVGSGVGETFDLARLVLVGAALIALAAILALARRRARASRAKAASREETRAPG